MRDVKIDSGELVRDLKRPPDKDEQLKKACKEFESVFTYEMLKSMRRTVEKCDLFHGGQGEEIYESMLDQELSKKMAGLGPQSLANLLYRKFHREEVGQSSAEDASLNNLRDRRSTVPLQPLSVGEVSSPFGWRKDPISGEEQFHQGVDLAAPAGTPVRAPEEGKVIMSDYQEGYGNFVLLDHGAGLTTLYAHNRENKVKEGDWVRKGGILATVGSTGRSTGPHLHFEVRRKGIRQDPRTFVAVNKSQIEV
jgi:murein DD-endopeptidase MepM/ murein hydrolase activator NlpD